MTEILSRKDGRGTRIPAAVVDNNSNILPRSNLNTEQTGEQKGFNTILKCRWCGEKSREIYIPQLSRGMNGKPVSIIYNYEPCQACKQKWSNMVVIIETTETELYPDCLPLDVKSENGKNLYPTGRHVGITKELARQVLSPDAENGMVFFLDVKIFAESFNKHFQEM